MAPSSADPSEPRPVSRVAGTNGGLPLSWASDANASRGYVVEWQNANCLHDCPVHWTEVAPESTNISLVSGTSVTKWQEVPDSHAFEHHMRLNNLF